MSDNNGEEQDTEAGICQCCEEGEKDLKPCFSCLTNEHGALNEILVCKDSNCSITCPSCEKRFCQGCTEELEEMRYCKSCSRTFCSDNCVTFPPCYLATTTSRNDLLPCLESRQNPTCERCRGNRNPVLCDTCQHLFCTEKCKLKHSCGGPQGKTAKLIT
jgi:hypothetical protein